MSTEPVPQAGPSDRSRQVARISGEYFFRVLAQLAQAHDGDITRAIVYFAIANANTSHIEQRGLGEVYGSVNAAPPDEERRPVSVLSLSQMLGMSFETARRHANKLIADGKCQRVRGGIIVPQAHAQTDEMKQMALTNLQNVRRFVRELRRAGVEFD